MMCIDTKVNAMKKILIAASLALALPVLSAPAVAADAAALAASKSCLACHAVDKKLMGPSYKDVAKKYAGDKTAEAKLVDKVMKGGGGVWGPIPMPANKVTQDEAKTLVQWILAQK